MTIQDHFHAGPTLMSAPLLRMPEVLQVTAVKRSTLFRLIQKGKFPAPIQLSERCVAFDAAAVHRWIAARISGEPLGLEPEGGSAPTRRKPGVRK